MSNEEVVRAFAEGATEGQSDNIIIEGKAIYSYGKHWPIAVKIPGKVALVNHQKRSQTTSKHTRLVALALKLYGWEILDSPIEDLKREIHS